MYDKYKNVIRYCECPNGHSEHPFVMPDATLGVDFCLHCGGIVRSKKKDAKEFSGYEHYCRQAKACSIKGDHSTAIEFYNEALKCTILNHGKWDVFCAIAGEYEAIGDYDLAESYWDKCHEIERTGGNDYAPRRIAERGDFLYRRGRFEEAIATYEESLKAQQGLRDYEIGLDNLKICARTIHFIIDSYHMLGKDIGKEKYHDELKHEIDRYLSKESHLGNEANAYYLSETAWKAYADDGLVDEALILIDSAIEINPNCPAEHYNRKAIMLGGSLRYDDALKWYDRALSKEKSNETFLKNKAECIREKVKHRLLLGETGSEDLDMINEALKTLPKNCDSADYLTTKAEILRQLGEPVKARICLALAAGDYDEVDEAERQLKRLKSTEDYINITGTQYYRHFAPFRQGTIVNLVKELDNPHDKYAIRVEIDGETVGYVANSEYTLIKEVKSARNLKYVRLSKAEVQFILFDEWVIAKLIKVR